MDLTHFGAIVRNATAGSMHGVVGAPIRIAFSYIRRITNFTYLLTYLQVLQQFRNFLPVTVVV